MENMEKLVGGDTERYIKPQMEIIEMGNDTIVTSGCQIYEPAPCAADGIKPCLGDGTCFSDGIGHYDSSGESISFC